MRPPARKNTQKPAAATAKTPKSGLGIRRLGARYFPSFRRESDRRIGMSIDGVAIHWWRPREQLLCACPVASILGVCSLVLTRARKAQSASGDVGLRVVRPLPYIQ